MLYHELPQQSTVNLQQYILGCKRKFVGGIWIWIVSRQGRVLEHHTDEEEAREPDDGHSAATPDDCINAMQAELQA